MRVRLTGSFELPGRLDAVLPLFTAEGERRWAPDAGARRLEHFAATYDDMLVHRQHHTSLALAGH